MSTYLKSAAMSLLSKTVQAFLTKYLSDVDVEGVTLPSYDGSGWGVRLSNVQLREGVQLMKMMPGKVVKKRIVKRRRRKRRMIEPGGSNGKGKHTSTSKDHEEIMKSSKPRSKNNYSNEGTKSRQDTHQVYSLPNNYPFLGEERKYPLLVEEEDGSVNSEQKKPIFRRSRTNSAVSASDFEIAVKTSSDYYTDDEIENDENGNPSTPAQPSNSMFSCFVKRKDKKDGNNELSGHSLHQRLQEQQLIGDAEVTANKTGTSEKSVDEIEKMKVGMDDNVDDCGEDEDMYEFYEEEEEYEEDQELPFRLCLGEHGRIGMVDVRLIGKELHVMAEDAMVTIEAIPILIPDEDHENDETHESSNDGTGGDNQNNPNSDDAVKESGEINNGQGDGETDNADTKNSTKKVKKEPKRDTVGDRVLADNLLARLISSIPHLFLRDICVRLIVRDEPMAQTGDEDSQSNTATEKDDVDGYSKPKSSSKDTMVEVGIDFLSVTSGEDILSRFQQEHTSAEEDLQNMNNENEGIDSSIYSFEDSVSTKPPSLLKIPSNFVDANGEHKNEYLIRHIRTGRGPSAGISVQLFVPNSGLSRIVRKSTTSSGDVWARQHWISSTNNHLLRCSGLDIQARIHMGTKNVETNYSWFYGEYVDDYDDSYEIDSMILFGSGMDAVAPGPKLPLPPTPTPTSPDPNPPIEPRMSRGNTPSKSKFESTPEDKFEAVRSEIGSSHQPSSSIHPGVDMYHIDANGIQSSKVPSSFHRVSRGMVLKSCKNCMQLPSEVSDSCWEEPPNSNINKESSLDSSIPMPGLVLQICIRDPLEINVDRDNIESIGLIQSLFKKPSSGKSKKDSYPKKESEPNSSNAEIVTAPSIADDVTQTTSTSTGFFSSLLYGKPEETIHEEVPEDSFETYMQPESISVMGVYLAETIIRIHIMREEKDDRNLSFCYWQVDTQCLTLDHQTLATPEKSFSDLKFDVGGFVWDEYKGTSQKNLVSLGVLQLHGNRHRSDSSNSVSSMIDDYSQNKAPWPSTACALLDIPPPTESLAYKSREGHAVQFRFISMPSSTKSDFDEVSRSMIYLRLGLTTVDSDFTIKNDISTTINQIMKSLAGNKKSAPPETENKSEHDGEKNDNYDSTESECKKNKPPRPSSLMSYTIQVDSGDVSLPPLIEVKMPMSRFSGERSSLAGFSIESELGKVDFSYGLKKPDTPKPSPLLPQIARLPESVRMHILLCLKDLSPLEIALNVKKEKNSFRRIKSVDKAMLKTAKKITKRDAKSSNKRRGKILDSANRRERILTEIMKLDDSELTNLWSVHQRYQKKLAKKLREEGQNAE